MSLKPDASIMAALATGAMIAGVYQMALPTIAASRVNDAGDLGLAKSENAALIVSVGVAGGVSLITGDSVPFIVGSSIAVVYSWLHRYANLVEPTTQKLADWVTKPGQYLVEVPQAR